MKKSILFLSTLLLFFCINLSAKAQLTFEILEGQDEKTVKEFADKGFLSKYPISEKTLANNGMPYLSYSTIDGLQRQLFYFSNGKLIIHRRLLDKRYAANLLKELEDWGYKYKEGKWISEDGRIIGVYSTLDNVISISFQKVE